MLQSLQLHCRHAHVFVLCIDDIVFNLLNSLGISNLTLLKLKNIEDEDLLKIKPTRGYVEYLWTLSPSFPWFIFNNYPLVNQITYLDADLFFYSSLDPIFSESDGASIVISEHRFSPHLHAEIIKGRFCVQWVGFSRDQQGLECLNRWRLQCLEWCFYKVEETRMGDQKYLDEWPNRFNRCHILQAIGAGLAPWNFSQYQFNTNLDGEILVNGERLIFYHFHQLQIFHGGKFDRMSKTYSREFNMPDIVYRKYESALHRALEYIRTVDPYFRAGIKSKAVVFLRRLSQAYMPLAVKKLFHSFNRY